jgi:hypothetical protein
MSIVQSDEDAKAERKRLKDAERFSDTRPLDPWERYRALSDHVDHLLDVTELADRKTRFALIILGALQRHQRAHRAPRAAGRCRGLNHTFIQVYVAGYVMISLYFFVYAIMALKPRVGRMHRVGEARAAGRLPGLRLMDDILATDIDEYYDLWRTAEVGQLDREMALQAYLLARANSDKFRGGASRVSGSAAPCRADGSARRDHRSARHLAGDVGNLTPDLLRRPPVSTSPDSLAPHVLDGHGGWARSDCLRPGTERRTRDSAVPTAGPRWRRPQAPHSAARRRGAHLDPKVGDFEKADVLIDGKTIADIEPSIAAGDAEVIDCSGTIVMPGFITTHHHQYETLQRSIIADGLLAGAGRRNLSAPSSRTSGPPGRIADPANPSTSSGIWARSLRPRGLLHLRARRLPQRDQRGHHDRDRHLAGRHTPAHTDAMIKGLMDSGRRMVFDYSGGHQSQRRRRPVRVPGRDERHDERESAGSRRRTSARRISSSRSVSPAGP